MAQHFELALGIVFLLAYHNPSALFLTVPHCSGDSTTESKHPPMIQNVRVLSIEQTVIFRPLEMLRSLP